MVVADDLPDTPPSVIFPPACPGCCEDFDPRRHTEAWCRACRPADGTHQAPADGSEDHRARRIDLAGGNSDTDGANQRAAGMLWGRDRAGHA
jgi:hypothetical protein